LSIGSGADRVRAMLARRSVSTAVAAMLWAATSWAAGPSCFDGVKNGPESDVDCGGDCPPCDYGDVCVRARDCVSGLCAEGECIEREHPKDAPVPAGYRVEVSQYDAAASVRKIGIPLFAVSFGGAYIAGLSLPSELAWMQAPLIGPWLSLSNAEDEGLKVLIVADGVLQAAGAIMIFGGVSGRGYRLVRKESARLQVVPQIGVGRYGLALGSVF
jgi:hypothetical protein